jgi:aerobic-type carbon monoxide dehydrogenase small subunit (CoxS/CutS family)
MTERVAFTVNGRPVVLNVPAERTLLEALRHDLGLTGTKKGCGTGECGACTVLLDGAPVNACLVLAVRVDGRDVTTVEGLQRGSELHPLQAAFVEHAAVQCGFCAPGMLMASAALLAENPHPTAQEVRLAIAGNLCRCSGYTSIVEAVVAAGRRGEEGR